MASFHLDSRIRRLVCGCLVLLATALVAAGSEPAFVSAPPSVVPPDSTTRYYTMAVRFRPLLFWMTRDDVGGARISWNHSSSPDRFVELLVGSDPEHAPMSMNRWGFISERTQDGTARLTGVMTETDDHTIDAARANGRVPTNPARVFSGIRATVRDGQAATATARIVVDRDFTYRNYTALLDRLPSDDNATQRVQLKAGTDPGFLTALKALVHQSTDTWQRTQRLPGLVRRDYVYVGKLYSLSLKSATLVNDALVSDRHCGPAVDGEFEIVNKTTGTTTSFAMLYGLTGPETETPLRIVYRPRWWIELQLALVEPSASKVALAMSGMRGSSR